MDPITSISTALSSLKTAAEVAKAVRDSEKAFDQAELRLKLAQITESLADARLQMVEVREALAEKDARIAELEAAFAEKGNVAKRNDAMYRVNAAGEPEGEPFCLNCWSTSHRLTPLVVDSKNWRNRRCTFCKTEYDGRLAGIVKSE